MMWLASSTILSMVVGQNQPIIVKKKESSLPENLPSSRRWSEDTSNQLCTKACIEYFFSFGLFVFVYEKATRFLYGDHRISQELSSIFLSARLIPSGPKGEADTTGWPSCDSCFDAFSHTHKDKQTQTHNNEHMHSIIISSINWWWSRIDTSGKGNFYIIVWTSFLIGFSVVIIHLTNNIFAFITVAIVKIANSIIGIVTPSPPPSLAAKFRLDM